MTLVVGENVKHQTLTHSRFSNKLKRQNSGGNLLHYRGIFQSLQTAVIM